MIFFFRRVPSRNEKLLKFFTFGRKISSFEVFRFNGYANGIDFDEVSTKQCVRSRAYGNNSNNFSRSTYRFFLTILIAERNDGGEGKRSGQREI